MHTIICVWLNTSMLLRLSSTVSKLSSYVQLLRISVQRFDSVSIIIPQSKTIQVKTVVGVANDLFFFLIILSPFLLAFGVACQSVMYTNEWRSTEVFFGVLVKPFYSMFGELFLGENTNYYFTGNGRIGAHDYYRLSHQNLTSEMIMPTSTPIQFDLIDRAYYGKWFGMAEVKFFSGW